MLHFPFFYSASNPTNEPPQAPAPSGTPQRVRRVSVLSIAFPMVVVEATPAAASDLMGMAGIRQIEPRPDDCEPDHNGSCTFTLLLSALYDFHALIGAINRLNEQEILPDCFREWQ